jgi:hypothetical protein
MSQGERKDILNNTWEYNIKRSFGRDDPPHYIMRTSFGTQLIHKDQIEDCFQKEVIPRLVLLVESQIQLVKDKKKAPPKASCVLPTQEDMDLGN